MLVMPGALYPAAIAGFRCLHTMPWRRITADAGPAAV
jgi:hypothetical protein